jgi:putative membrane protein
MTKQLSEVDHRRVADAIRAAEKGTSGEIYCVLARQSGDYFYPAAFAVLCAMVVVDLLAALAIDRLWLAIPLPWFAAAEACAAVAVLAMLWFFPAFRIHLVPRHVRFRGAHDNALRQFLARNVHRTGGRTGVLIFVSLAEHYATVIADEGIDAKVPEEAWTQIVNDLVAHARADRLAEGYLDAIRSAGALLAQHFPSAPSDRNELDDHLAEI